MLHAARTRPRPSQLTSINSVAADEEAGNAFNPCELGGSMGEDSERFRERARQCRELAPLARDDQVREELLRLADELDEEADAIDAERDAGDSGLN